jgi:hypothetical protein
MAKSWKEKFLNPPAPEVKETEKPFAGIPGNSMMLIPTPQIIADYVEHIPLGQEGNVITMREDLARSYHAEWTCPLTTGIFLRIAAEKAWEEYQAGKSLNDITPFWRIVLPGTPLANKLACGEAFIIQQRKAEGLSIAELKNKSKRITKTN